mgnify:CR=1 FL=1
MSRNGTFVNGEKIGMNNSRILQNDDVISLAHQTYKGFYFEFCFSFYITQFYFLFSFCIQRFGAQ